MEGRKEGRKTDQLSPPGNSLPPELNRRKQNGCSPASTGGGVRRALSSQACRAPGALGHLPRPGCLIYRVKGHSFCGSFQKVLWTSLEAPGGWQVWGLGRREAPVTQGLWEERKEESEARQALRSRTLLDGRMERTVKFASILPQALLSRASSSPTVSPA